jgi:hypothetical protein
MESSYSADVFIRLMRVLATISICSKCKFIQAVHATDAITIHGRASVLCTTMYFTFTLTYHIAHWFNLPNNGLCHGDHERDWIVLGRALMSCRALSRCKADRQ